MTTGHTTPTIATARSTRTLRAGLIGVLSAGIVLVGGGAHAATVQQCETGYLDLSEQAPSSSALVEAMEEATRAGAMIRVRAYDSVGGDIEQQFADELKSCASWRSPNGSRRANLLWVGVAIADRKTGIEYGEAHARRLDDAWLSVTTSEMNPQFRTGAYTEGLVAGVEALTELIEAPIGAPVGVGAGAPAAREDSAGEGAGISGSAVLGIAGGLVGLGVLGIGGVGISRGVQRRRKRLEQLAAAAGSARSAKQEVSTCYLDVEGRSARILAEAELVTGQVSDEDDVEIASFVEEAQRLTSTAGAAMSAASEGPDPAGSHTREVYEAIASAYQEAGEEVAEAGAALDALESHCQGLNARIQDLDDTLAAQQEQCGQVQAALAKAAKAGWSISSGEEALEGIRSVLQEGAAMLEVKRIGAASEHAEDAGAALASLEAWVAGLGQELARLTSTRTRLQGEAAALTPRLAASEAALTRMHTRHSARDVRDVAAALTGAEAQLDTALGALSGCSITKDASSWATNEETLTEVAAVIAKISSQCAQVEERAALLASLSSSLERRLSAVETLISQVEGYASSTEGTGTWSERELDEARAGLSSARQHHATGELLAADAACSSAEHAAAAADRSVRADRKEQERREQAAQRAIREAQARISSSQSYVSRNRSRAGSRATSGISESERLLRDAQSSQNLVLAVSLAQQAEAAAASAERAARTAVDDAARAARAASSSSSSSGSSSFGGGGGSSDWGSSSSDGGGGSSSW